MNRTKKSTAVAVTACVLLHFCACTLLHIYTSIYAFSESWYNTYAAWPWISLGLWLLVLLALDIWLFFSVVTEPLRTLKRYWGFGTGVFAAVFLAGLLGIKLPDLLTVPVVILIFLFPANQIQAFSWLLFHECTALSRTAQSYATCGLDLLFCLIHFIYFAWLHRRAVKKGAPPDGPVDPGAGTVE